MVDLVPEVYRAEAGAKELTDNKILTVAIRYNRYTDVPVVFITDDRSLSNKAAGEDIEVWTAKDFLASPAVLPEEAVNTLQPTAVSNGPATIVVEGKSASSNKVAEAAAESPKTIAMAEQKRDAARKEFLAQKISVKNLHLEARQISVLQNNGIKTLADFMAQTEESFSAMKSKQGIFFTERYLKEQESIRKKLASL